ncbi:MAG TPA: hypothetical protein VGV89_06885 [Thermoplasmata archaeon]|nr:hypothetical protein [Candidatus Acidoferrales bacterium]HEV2317281.1 hypothetical protein [Thermoplasmata archaeon]
MADGLCDWDDGTPHPRNHILTTLNPPATVELCDDHYGPGMIPLVAAELGLNPGDFYANVERYAKREQAKADKALAAAEQAEANLNGGEVQADDPAGDGGGGPIDDPEHWDENPETGDMEPVA